MDLILIGAGVLVILIIVAFIVLVQYRIVVETNEMHIVQSRNKTKAFGKDTNNGNVYYAWPDWVPVFGISNVSLPVSIFDLDLINYEAYDKGRLPFVVDIKAFFRINNSDVAAQRMESFEELENQLKAVVQGAVRSILASNEIEEIMQGRSKFGHEFTVEVSEQLLNWGVETVKNIELMDIRDHLGSNVIKNIMEKKKSHIEMESRQEVAKNRKTAEIAEIEASREVDIQKQQTAQSVGLRTVEANRTVHIASQEMQQAVKEQEKITKEKDMAILFVQSTRTAEIEKQVKVVRAEQEKETLILIAEGNLESKRREAMGIVAEGDAKAAAEKAMQLAPVEAQIVLAKEIGANKEYQEYLVTIRKIEADQEVGIEQAQALVSANVKIIANTGDPVTGVKHVMDLFSSRGGTQMGAMVEAFANSETGSALLAKAGIIK